jgi:hypothetical protein
MLFIPVYGLGIGLGMGFLGLIFSSINNEVDY